MRLHVKTEGLEALLYLLSFGGGKHRFKDHSHARNFVRYLFSKSVAHPTNSLTGLNLVCEYDEAGKQIARRYNREPDSALSDFLRRRFPASGADRALFDDGCYPLFALRLKDGLSVSNFIRKNGARIEADHPLSGYLGQAGIARGRVKADMEAFAGAGAPSPFDGIPETDRIRVEAVIHDLIRRMMGGQVILTVSHQDQPDHNPVYHVHRLVAL